MQQTLIAIFDGSASVIRARHGLMNAGFSSGDIVVYTGEANIGSAFETSTGPYKRGGVRGQLRFMFGSDDDMDQIARHADAMRRGAYLLAVYLDGDEQLAEAQKVLRQHGAQDPNVVPAQASAEQPNRATPKPSAQAAAPAARAPASTTLAGAALAAAAAADLANAAMPTTAAVQPAASLAADGAISDAHTVPVLQETLHVGKQQLQRGGLRVSARLVEEPFEQTVQLRNERTTISRRAVNRPATPADFAVMAGGTIEVLDRIEEVVVYKQARVVEEIALSKQVAERTQEVRDTVRHTDVKVERFDREHAVAGADAEVDRRAADDRRPGYSPKRV